MYVHREKLGFPRMIFFQHWRSVHYLQHYAPVKRRYVTEMILVTLKAHARDFHSLFLNFFLHISVTNRYKTQSSQHFRKYSSNSHRYLKFSVTCRFRRKREAWLSIVTKNAGLNLALSSKLCVFGSLLAFSAKTQNQTSRFRRKRGVKLIVVGENAE